MSRTHHRMRPVENNVATGWEKSWVTETADPVETEGAVAIVFVDNPESPWTTHTGEELITHRPEVIWIRAV